LRAPAAAVTPAGGEARLAAAAAAGAPRCVDGPVCGYAPIGAAPIAGARATAAGAVFGTGADGIKLGSGWVGFGETRIQDQFEQLNLSVTNYHFRMDKPCSTLA
jgi:hypothetical protein